MKLLGYCNGESKKIKCANVSPKQYEEIDFPVTKNGFILTGIYPNGLFLWVIDIDGKGNDINPDILTMFFDRVTLTVQTGSHGLHFYFWIKDGKLPQKQYKTHKLEDEFPIAWNVEGIDLRGTGGKIFAAGCKFEEHKDSYKIIRNEAIALISVEDGKKMLKKLLKQQYFSETFKEPIERIIINKGIQTPPSRTTKATAFNITAPIRKRFRDILTGDYLINHGNNKRTNIQEFVYWAALWRECLSMGMTVSQVASYLTSTQPAYDHEITLSQLNCLRNINIRPTRKLYYKLFPDEAEDIIEELIGEIDVIKSKQRKTDAILKQITDQFNVIQNKSTWRKKT